jgi:hypothetical protein
MPPPAPAQQATYTPTPVYYEPNYAQYMPGTAKAPQQATLAPATQAAPSQPILAPKPIPAPRRTPSPQPPLDASTQAGGPQPGSAQLRVPSTQPPERLRTPSPQPGLPGNGLLNAAQAVTGAIEALVVNSDEPAPGT